jgi:hypothetical protein
MLVAKAAFSTRKDHPGRETRLSFEERASAVQPGAKSMTIKAKKIQAKNVVSGVQAVGVKPAELETIQQWVAGRLDGSISADVIEADNVVQGLQWIAPGVITDLAGLRGRLGEFEEEIRAGARYGETRAAGQALTAARKELDQPQPSVAKVLEKLERATKVLTKASQTAEAAGHLSKNLIRWSVAVAGLWQIAAKVLGG